MRPATAAPPRKNASFDRRQQQLDDALADTFPASDPVSIVTSQREELWDDRPPNPADVGERDEAGVKRPAT